VTDATASLFLVLFIVFTYFHMHFGNVKKNK
jgi:hypothetical protein